MWLMTFLNELISHCRWDRTLIIAEADFLECRLSGISGSQDRSQRPTVKAIDWQSMIGRSQSEVALCVSQIGSLSDHQDTLLLFKYSTKELALLKSIEIYFANPPPPGGVHPPHFPQQGTNDPVYHSITVTQAPQHHSLWFTGTQAPQVLQHHGHHPQHHGSLYCVTAWEAHGMLYCVRNQDAPATWSLDMDNMDNIHGILRALLTSQVAN